jgi:ABC-type uncharacterized transport system substrate-binding protein
MALAGVYRKPGFESGKRVKRYALVFRAFLAMLLSLAGPSQSPARGEDQARILFLASQRTAPYTEFVSLTRQTLDTGNPLVISGDTLFAEELAGTAVGDAQSDYDLIVAMGTRAAGILEQWQPQTPVIYTLIPEITFAELKQSLRLPCYRDLCTAVYIDQPLERQIRIVHAAFGKRRIGVLFGPASRRYRSRLEQATERYGVPLATAMIDDTEELLPALKEILQDTGVLLALPDPVVYNGRTAQSVLLTTYRYKVPMVAFSKAYIDAGATLSVYSTPGQMAAQTGKLISDFMKGDRKDLPPPDYPEKYRVQINRHVARSIAFDFEDNPEFLSIMKESSHE